MKVQLRVLTHKEEEKCSMDGLGAEKLLDAAVESCSPLGKPKLGPEARITNRKNPPPLRHRENLFWFVKGVMDPVALESRLKTQRTYPFQGGAVY